MRREFWVGLLLIAVYLVLASATTQILHFSQALDEGYHLEYVTFIRQNGRLPISYEERAQITRADFPPLYQLLVVALSAGIPLTEQPDFKYYYDSFRYRAVDMLTDHPGTFRTEDLSPPYLGRFLVWQIGRWLSVGLSLTTLVVIFLTMQALPLGQRPLTSVAGAAIIAFTPRFLILSSSLNDDNLLGLVAALYFWALVQVIKLPTKWWPVLLLGLFLGVSMTVKYTLVLVPLEILLVMGGLVYWRQLGWRWAIQRMVVIALLAVLFSSWWFGWNIGHMNTIAEDGPVVGLIRPLLAGGSDATMNRLSGVLSSGDAGFTDLPENTRISTFPQWVRSTFLSFWGYTVAGNVPLAPYIYLAIIGLLAVAVWGLWRLWQTQPASRLWLGLMLFHVGLFFVLPLIRFGLTRRLGVAAQGRHILIPAATAIAALVVWGLAAVIPRRWRGSVFGVIIGALIGWTGLHLYQLYITATPLLPMRTLSQAAEWLPEPVNAQFGDAIELVSYELDPQPTQGQLNLNLAWRSLNTVNENHLLKITLLNEAGEPVSQWVGYNGNGRLPTLAWDPGDSVFDRLSLPLPNLPAGDYSIQVQLIGQNGQPVSVSWNGVEQDALTLTETSLPESSAFVFGDDLVTVWPPAQTSVRYPGTFIIVTETPEAQVELFDPGGVGRTAAAQTNGVFNFVVGPRWPSGDYAININGQSTGVTVVVENWWLRQFAPPDDIETPVQANFAEQVLLLGYSLPQKQVQAGEAFPVTLYWQALPDKSPQANFIQFNNLLDSNGEVRGGYERLPLEYYSTLLWVPGEVVIDGYAVPVDANAPPGDYYLDVGLYLTVGEAAVNLPLVFDGQRSEVSSVTIGPIEVLKPVGSSDE
jgi:hypothetical protein